MHKANLGSKFLSPVDQVQSQAALDSQEHILPAILASYTTSTPVTTLATSFQGLMYLPSVSD